LQSNAEGIDIVLRPLDVQSLPNKDPSLFCKVRKGDHMIVGNNEGRENGKHQPVLLEIQFLVQIYSNKSSRYYN
jgi:hypothetical protein